MKELTKAIKSTTAKTLRGLADRVEPIEETIQETPVVWRSTPGLKDVIETDGNGNFRWVKNQKMINIPKENKSNKAPVVRYFNDEGQRCHVSLQKFVALIYHPVLNHEVNTRVIDGNRSNLAASNVEWVRPKNGTTY